MYYVVFSRATFSGTQVNMINKFGLFLSTDTTMISGKKREIENSVMLLLTLAKIIINESVSMMSFCNIPALCTVKIVAFIH